MNEGSDSRRGFPRTLCGSFRTNFRRAVNSAEKSPHVERHVHCSSVRIACEAKEETVTGSLFDAAKLMWKNDCGVLPIIDDGQAISQHPLPMPAEPTNQKTAKAAA